jgi:hypothetical protein
MFENKLQHSGSPITLFAWQEIRRRCDCYSMTSKASCERCGLQLTAAPLRGDYKARIIEDLITLTKKEHQLAWITGFSPRHLRYVDARLIHNIDLRLKNKILTYFSQPSLQT